ncbi:MAG: SpoIID/LytB domain-containing protein [Bacteroidales bacterium]|nr:MAG: SpoIID/LytB domain-containing protein [Bacteroidales bacterium]
MKEPSVQVGIMNDHEISFVLRGNFLVSGYRQSFSGSFHARINSGTIEIAGIGNDFRIEGEIEFKPVDYGNSFFVLQNVTIGIDFHWEQKEEQRFRGSLKLLKDDTSIIAINTLPVEDYLLSVISSEMKATGSLEFLKAHSVISRSWLIAQMNRSLKTDDRPGDYFPEKGADNEIIKWYGREDHKLFDVCADDHCQRYQGITRATTKTVGEAVKRTRGLVLLYNNRVCDTRFSKSCGGISESFENVWESVRHPYLTKVIDYNRKIKNFDLDLTREEAADQWIRSSPPAFCNTTDERILSQVLLDYDRETTDFYRWKVEYSQEEISEIIKQKSGMDFGKIIDLVPVERGCSGRLIRLKITGAEREMIVGKELEIRKLLSHSHLYSAAFTVDRMQPVDGIPMGFVLTGAGWGHGVGLCQIGAAVMGDKGYSYDEILKHYFTGARISCYY